MTQWLEMLTELMNSHSWLAPVLCLLAGVITSFTPCSLSMLPSVLAYVGAASGTSPPKAFRLSLVMAMGMAVTFAVFGSLASVIGHFLHEAGHWWSVLLGVLMILMALQVWGIVHLIPHGHLEKNVGRKGYAGAFLVGMLSGAFASHCATPVMIALLALVAKAGERALFGVFLMAIYSIGHSILLVAAGTSYSMVERWIENPRYAAAGRYLRGVMGAVFLVIGVFMVV